MQLSQAGKADNKLFYMFQVVNFTTTLMESMIRKLHGGGGGGGTGGMCPPQIKSLSYAYGAVTVLTTESYKTL